MLGSRTFKTLTALLITMTAGAYLLMLMESAPIRPPARSLAALAGGLFMGLCAILLVAVERLVTGQPATVRLLWPLLLISGVSGLGGAFFDSLLGATVQRMYYCEVCGKETEQVMHHCGSQSRPLRGLHWLDNDFVNLLSSGIGSLFAVGLTLWLI